MRGSTRPGYVLLPRPTTSATRSRLRISRSRAPAARSGSSPPQGRRRSSCRTRTRPPTTRRSTRGTSSVAAARSSFPTPRSSAIPALVDELLGRPERLARMREAMLALARPDAADGDRRGADRACPALSRRRCAGRRLYFVGIGGSGLSAYANIARAWGAEVRGWDLRDTIFMETLDGSRDRRRRRADASRGVGGRRLDRARGPDRRRSACDVPRRARRVAPVDRRRRRAREDDDRGDDRVRPARARPRPVLDHRRRRPAARRQRRNRRRAGSSSRATSPIARSSTCDPRSPSSRTSSSTTTRPTGPRPSCARSFDEWLATVPAGRAQLGARAGRRRARGRRRAQPRRTRPLALAALELRRGRARAGREALVRFTGVERRFELRRRGRGVVGLRRLRPQPDGARA